MLARWNDPARSPAVVERVVGDGRVLLWTTTADRAGNDWPIEPSFVLAVREAVRGTARPTRWRNTVTAGERPRRVVHSSQQVAERPADAPGRRRAAGRCRPSRSTTTPRTTRRRPSRSTLPDTRRAGLYRLSWDEGPLGTQQDLFAANPDPRESALERIAAADLKAMLAPLKVEVAVGAGRRHRRLLGDRPRDLARAGVGAPRPPDRRADPGDLGGPIPLSLRLRSRSGGGS